MSHFICSTCGTQFAESAAPPAACPICDDERQYVGHGGQQWTTLEALRETHQNVVREEEPQLFGIASEPGFAIGQRALLIQSPAGNVLWDCISLIDNATVASVRALGGISAIAISHPHFHASMIEWSRAFDGAPIYVHAVHRNFVMRPDPAIVFWEGDSVTLQDGVALIRCGGHFPGSAVLHWRDGADGLGALFTGDTVYVVADRRYVSFMYSYPNLIPLPAHAVDRIVRALEPYAFKRIYSAWFERVLAADAKAALARSAERYKRALSAPDR